ncbi:Hypothetical protein R9X50_00458500 [Acrodontium crateriforme]|uniref:Protein YAE1 n=1 Tax=Acrodontium crateriforme TaxID=150365 RepID=A0AAQ3M7W7_9PEZI|nr:Hypothetical protein R9X50_00458500 [Acrodontium crateriforme]
MIFRDVGFSHRGADHDAIFMDGPNSTVEGGNTHVDPLDDVFGSAPNSPVLRPSNTDVDDSTKDDGTRYVRTEFSDVPKLRTTHVTNGYREGIAASKEQHIQAGFDEGYSLGAQLGLKAGRVLGQLEGIWHAVVASEQAKSKASVTHEEHEIVSELGGEAIAKMLADAEKELSVQALFGKEYFGADGIWTYDVPGQEDESETTFEHVATAHPALKKWDEQLTSLAGKLGLVLR